MNEKYISKDNLQMVVDGLKIGFTPNWDQNDPNGNGYIEGRTHYETDPVETVILEESTIEGFEELEVGIYGYEMEVNTGLQLGMKYTVVFDGTTYEDLVCFDEEGTIIIGSTWGIFSNYPFSIYTHDDGSAIYLGIATYSANTSHTVSVTGYVTQIVQLDEKYISYKPGRRVEGTTYIISNSYGNAYKAVAEHGAEVFNDYINNKAIGYTSHAEGRGTIASGSISHAEGRGTIASGEISHAEGEGTTASGDFSHAEGNGTTASGKHSHAEGYRSTASGPYSHAEGNHTTASGDSSHAEGSYTTSSGDYSHAEGIGSTASGRHSHAEGTHTTASGDCSHAEGSNTTASGDSSHAEGSYTSASGEHSHAEGYSSNTLPGNITTDSTNEDIINTWKSTRFLLAKGLASHAEGRDTLAIGDTSHAEGYRTIASGIVSHAEGTNTTASGDYSHAEGWNTTASGEHSHAEGGYETTASGNCSHAEGYCTTASGNCSHAEGYCTTASGNSSHAEGHCTTASIYASHAEGGNLSENGVWYEDRTIKATDSGLSEDITIKGSCAYGVQSHAEGTQTFACGYTSHAEGYRTIASGIISHAEGNNTEASGNCSHAEGYCTTASGDYQHVQGKYNIEDTDNKYAHIVGNGTADNARSNAHTVDWDGNAWYAGSVEATALILKSPNGTRFQITIDDTGVLTASEITE